VFVSSDSDDAAFSGYYGEQPWLALPYTAREQKAALSRKYKVSGIPSLVLLDGRTGETLTVDGREVISDDPTGAEFPWPKKSLLELLGGLEGELLASPSASGDGDNVAVSELWGKKKLAIYFSAHW
jgi:nucleoredoxin